MGKQLEFGFMKERETYSVKIFYDDAKPYSVRDVSDSVERHGCFEARSSKKDSKGDYYREYLFRNLKDAIYFRLRTESLIGIRKSLVCLT